MKEKRGKGLVVFAVICYVLTAIMIYKGYDKMTSYSNSDSILGTHKNAYVGGDAYNYIINGTYSTSFFVLAVGFLITGTICIIGDKVLDMLFVIQRNNDDNNHKESDVIELPDL